MATLRLVPLVMVCLGEPHAACAHNPRELLCITNHKQFTTKLVVGRAVGICSIVAPGPRAFPSGQI